MKHLLKIIAAVLLAVSAAALNFVWLSAKAKPPAFVAVKAAVAQGEVLGDELLESMPIPGRMDELRQSFIPYAERHILFGMTATRDYQPGDMVLYRDIQTQTEPTQFQHLGPFRLISVGEKFNSTVTTEADVERSGRGSNVTIAVKVPYEDRTRRLLEIIAGQANPDAVPPPRIVAVEVYPTSTARPAATTDATLRLPLAEDERALFISLEDIENVPRVLLVGDEIGFVIPPRSGF